MTNAFRPVIDTARRLLCATRGHDTLLHIEPQRISLRCVTCGHETTGWTIGEPALRDGSVVPPRRRREASHAI